MIREVSAMEARQNFGELLNEVKYRHDNVLITKGGKPIAALIDVELFEKVKKMRAQFDALTSELSSIYNSEEESQAESDITAALKDIRKK